MNQDVIVVQSTPFEMKKNGLDKKFLPLTLPTKELLDGSILRPQMGPRFEMCVKEKTGKTFLAYRKDETGNFTEPAGWALTFNRLGETHFFVYVDKQHRRQGIASVLLESAKALYEDVLTVSPWNPDSKGFYDQATEVKTYPYVKWTKDTNL